MRALAQYAIIIFATLSCGLCRGADEMPLTDLKANIKINYDRLISKRSSFQDDWKESSYEIENSQKKNVLTSNNVRRSCNSGYVAESKFTPQMGEGTTSRPPSRVFAHNPLYSFRLLSENDSPWLLQKCAVIGTVDYNAEELKAREDALAFPPHNAHYQSSINVGILKILDSPGTTVTNVTRSIPAKNLYRVAFVYKGKDIFPTSSGKSIEIELSGWWDISPDLSWSIVASDEKLVFMGIVRNANCTYETKELEGVHFLTREIRKNVGEMNGKSISTVIEREYNPKLVQSEDISLFTLSHYGLPEPEGVEWKKPIANYVWWISAAVGLALLSLVLGWILKRRQRAATAKISPKV